MSLFSRKKRLTGPQATNFYYSFVFLPPEKRRAIEAVYAFARRGDDLADGHLTVADAREGIARYRRSLEACFTGDGAGGDHPELLPLAESIRRFQIPREPFEDLILGLEMDLGPVRYETFEDLSLYCYRVASTIGLIAIEIFGYRNPRARDYAVNLGKALQLVNILRDVQSDARLGRIYLDAELGPGKAAALHFFNRCRPAGNRQGFHLAQPFFKIAPGAHQRADEHVPGYAGKTIEI